MPEPPDRRRFFQESFRSIARPLAEFIANRIEGDLPRSTEYLRPPGALDEAEFLATCYRCGNCVEACPANAIQPLRVPKQQLHNTPIVDADISACVICDELACMKTCPSGALKLVDSIHDIDMGTARVYQNLCVRSHGEECVKCIEVCPIGESAISLDADGKVRVHDEGCVGCGVCQMYCPTRPRAIVVIPRES